MKADINKQILTLLYEGATLQRFKEEIGLSPSELNEKLNNLKQLGYLIDRKYYSNKVEFFLNKNMENNDILRFEKTESITIIAYSDPHHGNCDNSFVNSIALYKYAFLNKIFNIFILGDIIENICNNFIHYDSKEYFDFNNISKNILELLKDFPFYDSINNYILFGNHDYHFITTDFLDVSKLITKNRIDFINLGYEHKIISIGNFNMAVHHPFHYSDIKQYDQQIMSYAEQKNTTLNLILRGHSHKSDFYVNDYNVPVISVPHIMNIDKGKCLPGAWELTIRFNRNGNIIKLEASPLIFIDNMVHKVSTFNINLNANFKYDNNLDNNGSLSQIDKFEKKYSYTKQN